MAVDLHPSHVSYRVNRDDAAAGMICADCGMSLRDQETLGTKPEGHLGTVMMQTVFEGVASRPFEGRAAHAKDIKGRCHALNARGHDPRDPKYDPDHELRRLLQVSLTHAEHEDGPADMGCGHCIRRKLNKLQQRGHGYGFAGIEIRR